MERINEIEERMAAIKTELDIDGADLDALEAEVRSLNDEKAKINEAIEKRKAIVDEVNKNGVVIRTFKEEKMEERTFGIESKEYRNAWLKTLQGKPVDEIEQRALTGGAYAMPQETANKIIETLTDTVPLLNEIDLFRMNGNISVPVQTVAPTATLEATGGAVTESSATLRLVTLTGYNINAFIPIGADLAQQSLSAFEDWLVRKLADAIAYKIEYYIINGDGNSAPKGIDYYVATWDDSDGTAVDWASTALGVADLDEAIGLIPAAYDKTSKFLMSKKTFFKSVIGLTDVDNFPVITRENGKFYIRGYEVIFSDQVTTDDIFFGDFKRGMVGNLSTDINVEKQRNLRYNTWDFLGWGVFDCEPAAAGCIIKIASDIQA